jgi:hypothetical protein
MPKFVKCIDNNNAPLLKFDHLYEVIEDNSQFYKLKGFDSCTYLKSRFRTVDYYPNDPVPVTPKNMTFYVKCINDYDSGGRLKVGTTYQVVSETTHDYILKGESLSRDKERFVWAPAPSAIPKPKKVYQHNRKKIINQLKKLNNNLVGRFTCGFATEVEWVQKELSNLILQLEKIKE